MSYLSLLKRKLSGVTPHCEATKATEAPSVPFVAPDRGTFEERAAIMQYDGGLSRDEAEQLAAAGQGHTLAAARRWLN